MSLRCRILHSLWQLRRVDDVDVTKQCDRAAVRYRVRLLRLSFAVIQRRAKPVGAPASDQGKRIPEVRSTCLVSDVAKHPSALTIFNLPEHLSPKLKVVALLIDGKRTVAFDIN